MCAVISPKVRIGCDRVRQLSKGFTNRLTTTEIYLNLSPEDAIREFLNKW